MDHGQRRARRSRSGTRCSSIYASQCYTIGLVSGVLQPVAARATLRNLPEEAIFNYEPHGQFGIYLLDTFWYDQ